MGLFDDALPRAAPSLKLDRRPHGPRSCEQTLTRLCEMMVLPLSAEICDRGRHAKNGVAGAASA